MALGHLHDHEAQLSSSAKSGIGHDVVRRYAVFGFSPGCMSILGYRYLCRRLSWLYPLRHVGIRLYEQFDINS
jgi:hypothetical protein